MTDATERSTKARLAFVMPVRNDARYLRNAVESIFAQHVSDGTEVILAVGPSEDKTRQVAADLAKEFPIVVLDNPSGMTSAALNLAMLSTSAETIIRVDAHSELEEGYAKLAVRILDETKAANVGGIMEARGRTSIQKAVAWAYGNFIGLGGGAVHTGGTAGPADTVYLGVFRREEVLEVGGFNERLVRGQDWELNARLREAGKTVWFDPRLKVGYYPRRDIVSLAKQFFTTGTFRAYILLSNPSRTRFKYLVPPAFILGSILSLVLTLSTLNFWWLTPLFAYAALVIGGAMLARGLSPKSRLALAAVLPTMHISWGIGFWKGVFSYPFRGDNVPLNTAAISVHS
jgi:glycosyltransferase involved in cell wall biosynthesis